MSYTNYLAFLRSVKNDADKITDARMRTIAQGINEIGDPSKSDIAREFRVKFKRGILETVYDAEILRLFKIAAKFSTTNMHLVKPLVGDGAGCKIEKYNNPCGILTEFYKIRLHYYELRKQHELKVLDHKIKFESAKAKFIELILTGKIVVFENQTHLPIEKWIEQIKTFPEFPTDNKTADSGYSYLTHLKISSLCKEVYDTLCQDRDVDIAAYKELDGTTPSALWSKDIDAFDKSYDKHMKLWSDEYEPTKKR
jgi:DNA topoisomerase-2